MTPWFGWSCWRLQVLVVAQREEGDFDGRIGDRDPRHPCRGCGEAGILGITYYDSGHHVGWCRAVDDRFSAAVIDEVMHGNDGDAWPFEPDLHVLAGGAADLAQLVHHRTFGSDDDFGRTGDEIGHSLFSDRLLQACVTAILVLDLRPGVTESVNRELLAVLFEDDAERGQLGRGYADDSFERSRHTDEFLAVGRIGSRARPLSCDDPGTAEGEKGNENETSEKAHLLIILGNAPFLTHLSCGW